MIGRAKAQAPAAIPRLGEHFSAQLSASTSIFRENATALPRASGSTLIGKLAAQLASEPALNTTSSTTAVYTMPAATPRVKVWLVESGGAEETLQGAGAHTNLQGSWESVPMPNPALIPHGEIWPAGTDKSVVLQCPETNELWEFWRLGKFASGPHIGEYKAAFGAYTASATTFDGVWANNWGTSACSIGIAGGLITMSDVVRMLRGEPLGHALELGAAYVANEHLAPATRNDSKEPGNANAVPEGLWGALPSALRASEFVTVSTQPLAAALIEAAREHGVFVGNSAGNPSFYVADPRTLFTPYSDTLINPFAGATYTYAAETRESYINEIVPAATSRLWVAPGLALITEQLYGPSGVLTKVPWNELEQLEPRAS
jgi:hypothetical protein